MKITFGARARSLRTMCSADAGEWCLTGNTSTGSAAARWTSSTIARSSAPRCALSPVSAAAAAPGWVRRARSEGSRAGSRIEFTCHPLGLFERRQRLLAAGDEGLPLGRLVGLRGRWRRLFDLVALLALLYPAGLTRAGVPELVED